jgi:peptidoglycan hydrolase-like protein with peptidoglycan-binding domain
VYSFRASVAFLLTAALIASPAFASRIHRAPTSGHAASRTASHAAGRTRSSRKSAQPKGVKASKASRATSRTAASSHKLHGQQSIDPARVTQIQEALIREHYMTGEATGQWDSTTASAMQKYQADQGWQTKLMPDSRAIKKLGLGPDYSGAINAKGASFTDPTPVSSLPASQSAAFASAAGVSR